MAGSCSHTAPEDRVTRAPNRGRSPATLARSRPRIPRSALAARRKARGCRIPPRWGRIQRRQWVLPQMPTPEKDRVQRSGYARGETSCLRVGPPGLSPTDGGGRRAQGLGHRREVLTTTRPEPLRLRSHHKGAKRGEPWCTDPTRPYADLWREWWHAHRRRGDVAESLRKVK